MPSVSDDRKFLSLVLQRKKRSAATRSAGSVFASIFAMGNCCQKSAETTTDVLQPYTLRIYEKTADVDYYSDVRLHVSEAALQGIDKQQFTFYHNDSIYCNHFPVLDPARRQFLHELRQRAREKRIRMRKSVRSCYAEVHYIVIL